MENRRLGRTGLTVSVVGLGTGGSNRFGQARGAGPEEARALVRSALDLGITFFDTAQGYGDSEDRLSAALDKVPRTAYVLGTKYKPRAMDGTLLSPRDVEASIRRSLVRLRTDVIDVFFVHALSPHDYDSVIAAHLPILARARDAGMIRAVGVTESFAGDDVAHATLSRAVTDGHFDVVMVGYNVLHQSAERKVIPAAEARGIGVIAMAAVRRALASQASLEALVAHLKETGELGADALPDWDPLGWLVHDQNPSVQAACYRYVAHTPAVSSVLTGTFRPSHLRENVEAVALGPLPAHDRGRLRAALGHLNSGLGN